MEAFQQHGRRFLCRSFEGRVGQARQARNLQYPLSSKLRFDCRAMDQGSQFTSGAWIDVLVDANIKISMDGKGAWRDNRMIERLWRSLKYECVYLNAFETGSEMRAGVGKWLTYYNVERPHSTHGILTPDEAYESKTEPMNLAA